MAIPIIIIAIVIVGSFLWLNPAIKSVKPTQFNETSLKEKGFKIK